MKSSSENNKKEIVENDKPIAPANETSDAKVENNAPNEIETSALAEQKTESDNANGQASELEPSDAANSVEDQGSSNEISINQPKKSRRIGLSPKKRRAMIACGMLLLVAGGAMTFFKAKPFEEEQQTILSSSTTKAETFYKVHLKPNQLYNEEWMEENLIYATALTDFIQVDFKADTVLSKEMSLSSDYKVTAVIEGYQTKGEARAPIYERRYVLKEGSTDAAVKNYAAIEEQITFDPQYYRNLAAQAEEILGGQTARDFYILFEGKFIVDSKENNFTQKMMMPIGKDQFFEITKTEASSTDNNITETNKVMTVPPVINYLPFGVAAAAGLLLSVGTAIATRVQTAEEAWRANLNKLLRKYASRLVCLEQLPDINDKMILRLNDMDSLVALAEELRVPVLYSLDEEELPTDGRFCVTGEEYIYILEYPKPQDITAIRIEQ